MNLELSDPRYAILSGYACSARSATGVRPKLSVNSLRPLIP